MDFLIPLIIRINWVSNALGGLFLYPVAILPGWLSITLISAALGLLLLIIFKYTSNQKAIARIRDDIEANMLAIKLFKGSISVTFRTQARVFAASFKLLYHSIVPMLIMMVPVSLILVQMGLWYQARPVRIDDEPVIVKLKLNDRLETWPEITLYPKPAAVKTTGPVRVFSKKEIYWKIKPIKDGYSALIFQIGDQRVEKRLASGDGFMRLSPKRPGPKLADILLYPLEKPFSTESPIGSISIDYPARKSRINGTDWWLVYLFVVSMAFAFIFKPFLKLRI